MLLLSCPFFSQNSVSLTDVKKEADNLFEDDEFTKAYKLYAQLVSNFPKDAEYNYRLGVCMIYSEPDKKKCIPYLKVAVANNANNEQKDALFYLGKAYHINYLFDEAIKNYTAYKKTASAARLKKLQVDKEIKACNDGKHLLSNLTDLVVKNKKQLNEADYFRSYDLRNMGGKLLVKPEEFKTAVDKKKKEKSIVFLPKGSNVVYFSSYGENTDSGKDIYTTARLQNGTYGKPEKVKGINTEFDEDYPFLHPDGKTLYFASKGYNSMGGYDIFKTIYNEETNTWSAPVNLEFPINSPDDDFLFVTDSLEKTAYFSTGRQSPPGKIDVLKINTERKPVDVLVIKGTVTKENEGQSVKSNVSIKNAATQEVVGTYSASENGHYTMSLPNGASLLFTVETPGFRTQTKTIVLPMATTSKVYRQSISYENGDLKITNFFDEATTDDDYMEYMKLIEEKAKLDVNEGENKLKLPENPLAVSTPQTTPEVIDTPDTGTEPGNTTGTPPKRVINNSKPEVVVEENATTPTTPPATTKQSVDNKQLATIARQDADESKQEAYQLEKDSKDAYEVGRKQKADAAAKLAEANAAASAAEAITSETEKKPALEKAAALKTAAENDNVIADKILALAKSLNDDSQNKRKEADLNNEYAKELDKTASAKNTTTQTLYRLEQLQKQIAEVSGQKTASAEAMNTLKTDIDDKEKQLASAEKINGDIKSNLDEIKTAIATKETELGQTRKKAAKEEITTQITALKTEQADKEKQLTDKDEEIKKINEELVVLRNEQELTTKIKTEDIVTTTTAPATTPAVTEPVKTTSVKEPAAATEQKITAKSLQEKYQNKTTISDTKNVQNIEESTLQLRSYNRELDQLIAKDRTELAKTKNAATKQQLTNNIKQLEAGKKQNQQFIASNNKLIADLNKPAQPLTQAAPAGFNPIVAATPADAVKSLDQLVTQLAVNENDNFDFNAYQNPAAQNLKIEADSKINDAIAQQKKLRDVIAVSKTEIQNAPQTAAPSATTELPRLNKEAEDLQNKALELKTAAGNKDGAEKEKLLNESKALEEQSNNKYLEAAKITKDDNGAVFTTNTENIQALIKENKSTEPEAAAAKKLNDEAAIAFKQAVTMRQESETLTNIGAKIGSISNAEEKEAEAILKQQQAVEQLKKANPAFVLKTPVAATTASGNNAEVLNAQLEAVNKNLDELLNTKLESYQKLYEANASELDQLLTNVNSKQTELNSAPGLKTDFISGTNKTESAKTLKAKSDATTNKNDKLTNLIAAIKKQNEAVKQVSTLSTSLDKLAATPKTTEPVTTQPEIVTTAATTTPPVSTPEAVPVTTPVETEPVAVNTTNAPSAETDLETLAKQDTTAEQIVNYFNTNTPDFKNQKAGNLVKNSLTQLKNNAAEEKAIDDEIENAGKATSSEPVNTSELKVKADNLLVESDQLSTNAQEKRTAAAALTGTEKDSAIAQANELDSQSQSKALEAAGLSEKANDVDYKTNAQAITELLGKLRTDNPTLQTELEQKNNSLTVIKGQAKELRTEANALTNTAARIGAISNAEEKETELLQKQNQLLTDLKKTYPDYVVKPATSDGSSDNTANLTQRKKAVSEKQYTELINLTNAFSLEYESSKTKTPKTLNAAQQATKQKAETFNAESKRLLIKSSQEKNDAEKIKLLTLAAKSGNAAVTELNKLVPENAASNTQTPANDLNALNEIGNNIAEANTNRNPPAVTTTAPVRTAPARNANRATVKVEGLEVIAGNAYNATRPIPLNSKMEDGLVFRVQIGAFKVQLPNDAFKGLSPLNAETTANGYFRYTAGNFNKFENANAVKNDLRGLGYNDAFVVGYYNGKRISLAEAFALLEKEGKTINENASQTAGITLNSNVPKATPTPQATALNAQEAVTVTKELEQINGLLYTIQVGVYNRVSKQGLYNLRPVFSEKLPGGLFRYTAGIYNNLEKVIADKRKVVDLGIRDAFVSAYLNGKRIALSDAKTRQETDATIKMEAENPIMFSDLVPVNAAPLNTQPAATPVTNPAKPAPTTVQPFTNGVSGYPTPNDENGVRASEDGITFKVQIGAYSKQVPADVAEKFSAIKAWPVENKQINTLFIYNIGNFSAAKFAKALKDEAVSVGLTDAFITVYKDGKKLYGPDAAQYLNR